MAQFIRGTGSDLTPIQHSRQIFREQLKRFSLRGISRKQGQGGVICLDTTLKGSPGDTVRHHFIPYTQSSPLRGQDIEILGNEESFNEYSLDVIVNEINYAFRKKGAMSDQRVIYSIRQEMSAQLADRFNQYDEDVIFKVASGIGYEDDDQTTWESSTNAVDRVNGSNRCFRADGGNGFAAVTEANSNNVALLSAMNTSDKLSLSAIRRVATAVRTANSASNDTVGSATNTYKMRPYRFAQQKDGTNREWFFLFCSLEAGVDLMETPEWINWQHSQNNRMSPTMEEIGAIGTYHNVIIVPSERIIKFNDGSGNVYARNLLMGADAVMCAWAQTTDYTEELIDHKRGISIRGGQIRGETKITFNGVDMGVAQLVTASNNNS
jgi:hypothetical protein